MERNKKISKYILITSMNFPSGGAGATYLNLFCRGLKSNGCDIKVYLLKGFAFGNFKYDGPRENVTNEGIPYKYLGFRQRPDNYILKIFDELSSLLRLLFLLPSLIPGRNRTHILIYSSEVQYNIPIQTFTRLTGIKLTKFVPEIIDKSEFNGSVFRQVKRYGYNFNYRYLNKRADKLIVFSSYLKDEYLKMGYKDMDIIVQPNLTDFSFWEPSEGEVKYDLGYSGAPYLKDGLHDLFTAISILKKQDIRATLLIIGDATFGESLIPPLKIVCEQLGILDNITFTGLVDSGMVKQYLSQCRMLAITRPSTIQTKAGFPTKLGEYYASRRPVLATNFGDMEKYFVDKQDIVMAKCGDPESIAEKIEWMIKNRDSLEQISVRGYKRAVDLLEYEHSVKRILDLLESPSVN
ncbi:MAG TPA: glycosyltransferase [Bacteroidales bacterium]|nr:glycosyltransferase [Bacteroidales bacterium]